LRQLFESAFKGAGEAGLVADEHVQGGAFGQIPKGEGETVITRGAGELRVNESGPPLDVIVEDGGFDQGEAAQTPAGGGHGLDQLLFDGVGGLETVKEGIEERLIFLTGFGCEDDGFGGEAVAQAVARGTGATLGGGGAV
jgi:hypothetical protein